MNLTIIFKVKNYSRKRTIERFLEKNI